MNTIQCNRSPGYKFQQEAAIMGNKQTGSNSAFQHMVQEVRKDQGKRVSINPEKKYVSLMLEELNKTKLDRHLREMVVETLNHKMKQVELIETITCIGVLKNNEFDISSTRNSSGLKDKPESKYVKINFGEAFLKKILSKLPLNIQFVHEEQTPPDRNSYEHPKSPSVPPKRRESNSDKKTNHVKLDENEVKERLKTLAQVMKKELNRISHPFGRLNKTFAEYIQTHAEEILPKSKPKNEQAYQKHLKLLIQQWCIYLQHGCLYPYKKWLMSYTTLEQPKYLKWINNIILQQIWAVNNGYLFSMLSTIIHKKRVPLTIDLKLIQYNAAILTPSLFNIDPKLQIQGHFFDSIYELSELVTKLRPEQILSQLQIVKKRICTDIDNYHRLVEKGQIYEIDSDNILGIVSYILCKIASKLDEIYIHLIFLRIIYGENVYYSMGIGSYMFSTIFGAFQFLESGQFRELIVEKRGKSEAVCCNEEDKSGKNPSVTKGTLSQKEETQLKIHHFGEEEEKKTCSLVLVGEEKM